MQSRVGSAVETAVNIGVGYAISVILTLTILPLFGYNVKLSEGIGISILFTGASIVRSYALRRFFNWYHSRQASMPVLFSNRRNHWCAWPCRMCRVPHRFVNLLPWCGGRGKWLINGKTIGKRRNCVRWVSSHGKYPRWSRLTCTMMN